MYIIQAHTSHTDTRMPGRLYSHTQHPFSLPLACRLHTTHKQAEKTKGPYGQADLNFSHLKLSVF